MAAAGGSQLVRSEQNKREHRGCRGTTCFANAFAFVNLDVNGFAVDFHLQKQKLLARAKRVEKKARREKNAQVQDIMRALALLYREMATEVEEVSVIPSYMY